MKILILSCDTGKDTTVPEGLSGEAAELKGHTVEMMDMFLFIRETHPPMPLPEPMSA